ncbi:tetratricopeptide repeat protein [Sphingomonas humi]|uniref:SPOR domain-containing protein n=1 Tax=Sphingomonas humi TaxID=335630 RepID=A0ABP7S6W3_9SPHN
MVTPKSALLAASSIVLAVAVTGCAMGGGKSHFGGMAENSNVGIATRAQLALQQGDTASAISLAERAVEKSPDDAAFRALLGNAYLAAGRFRSAEAAFADALAMYPNQVGVPLKLALAQAAQGRGEAAAATIDTYSQVISPADAGLALALAGRPGVAVDMLEAAARGGEADARVRQNLALSYALGGDWTKARQVAAQDLSGDQLEQRMAEWATFARPGASATQVASLIGVSAPASVDAGMPVRLALRAPARAEAVRLAEAPGAPVLAAADPAPAPMVEAAAPPAPVEMAAAEPAVPAMPAAEPAAPVMASAPDVGAMVDSLRAERVRAGNSLPKVAELRRSAARRFGDSKTVVQLGAYGSEAWVKIAWSKIARQHKGLSAYIPASARFSDTRGTFYRLSLKGFASDGEARQLCTQLKAKGSTCFVRSAAGDAPVRFASR